MVDDVDLGLVLVLSMCKALSGSREGVLMGVGFRAQHRGFEGMLLWGDLMKRNLGDIQCSCCSDFSFFFFVKLM